MKVAGVHEREGYVEVRLEGDFSLASLPEIFKVLTEASKRVGGDRLLVSFMGVTGRMPTTTERYELGLAASQLPKGLRIAAAAPPTFIDPERFAAVVARNRGANIEAFDDERAAIAWLLQDDPNEGGG